MARYSDEEDDGDTSTLLQIPHMNMTDEDSDRVPEGMMRVGYDADTQRTIYRDASGALYESAPGARYGELTPVGQESNESPERTEERNRAVEKGNREAVRMMLPFALVVVVFMLLLFKLVDRGTPADKPDADVLDCGENNHQTQIVKGDTCWKMAQRYSLGVEELLGLGGNGRIECEKLRVGQGICVPNGRAD